MKVVLIWGGERDAVTDRSRRVRIMSGSVRGDERCGTSVALQDIVAVAELLRLHACMVCSDLTPT